MNDRLVVLAGAGAIGSWIGFALARPGIKLRIVDDERIEEQNLAVSIYDRCILGRMKADALGEIAYHRSAVLPDVVRKTVTPDNVASVVKGTDLAVCSFDNVDGRLLFHELSLPVLQVGVSESLVGHVTWDEWWQAPDDYHPRGDNLVCTHQLGRRILRRTAMFAVDVIEDFLATGKRRCVSLDQVAEVSYDSV